MYKYLLSAFVSLGTIIGTAGVANAQAAKAPAPGTIVVHLNGLVDVQMNDITTSVDTAGGYKLNPLGMSGYIRLYPGFDGTTVNGIQYGVTAELRTAYTTAGVGQNEGSSLTSASAPEAMVVRRAYVYVGTPEYGFLRAGQTDSPWWLLSTGEYYNWGDHNNWNSDGGVGAAVPGAAHPAGLFTSSGSLYTTNKVVYLSPKLMGFQAGVSFEPNSNGFKEGQSCSWNGAGPGTGYTGCATLYSGPTASFNRRRNTVVGAIDYTNEFDGVGAKVGAAYLLSSPALPNIAPGTQLRQMGVTQLSAQLTYAGFLLGANVKFGQVNNGYTFLRPGARDVFFYNLTGEYTTGPYTFAVNYFNNQAAGAWGSAAGIARTESDYGIGVGANYELAKGMSVYAMYLYGHRHELGYNFLTSSAGSDHNNVQANAFTVGTVVSW